MGKNGRIGSNQINEVLLIGTRDTKDEDLQFLRSRLEEQGYPVTLIDIGVLGPENEGRTGAPASAGAPASPGTAKTGQSLPGAQAQTTPGKSRSREIPAAQVAEAGGSELGTLQHKQDKALAMEVMQRGLVRVVGKLRKSEEPAGVMAVGGGAGTSICTAAMRTLPLGIPKIMITTLASGDTRQYLEESDIILFPSIVDIAGVNSISAGVYSRAAGALSGMIEANRKVETNRAEPSSRVKASERGHLPVIAATMFGNTTAAVEQCRSRIEAQGGYQFLIFHATGTGGKTMEALISQGAIQGLLDITTTELADELAGGVLSAGSERLKAAARQRIPQVVAPGCLDMVNFWKPETVPGVYKDRLFYRWNPGVTLMRTNPEENERLGRTIAERLNRADRLQESGGPPVQANSLSGTPSAAASPPTQIFLPLRGLSQLDCPAERGEAAGPFWWPEADQALFDSIKKHIDPEIPVVEIDANINDPAFAEAAATALPAMMQAGRTIPAAHQQEAAARQNGARPVSRPSAETNTTNKE